MNQKLEIESTPLHRLWFRLTVAWSVAWILGLLIFAVLTAWLATRYYDGQVDSRLRIQAIAVYGLAYFNEDGSFESDLLDYDDDLFEPGAAVWFVEPSNPPVIHLDDDARFSDGKLISIAERVVVTAKEVSESGIDEFGQPFRLIAIPAYEVDQFDPRAAIIVSSNPRAMIDAKTRLLTWTGVTFALLGLSGLIVGAMIAKWSQQPLARFVARREQFLSAAAHELRTPLASISAVIDSAAAGNEPPADSLKRLGPLVRRATGSMEDLLLYARLDAGSELAELQPLRLDLLVEACLPDDVSCDLDLEETTVTGDRRLLEALIRNLLSNSLRHALHTSEISIRVRNGVLEFENDGASFSDEVISVASRDFRIAPSSTGSGLGLAIVQMIMHLHAGMLLVSNTATGNARVVCRFGK